MVEHSREKLRDQITAYCTGCKFFIEPQLSCAEPLAGLYQKRNALDKSCKRRDEISVNDILPKIAP